MIKSLYDPKSGTSKREGPLSNLPSQMERPTIVAIHRLRDAYDSAFACSRDPWDFSVELSQMQTTGVETHVLRMLICKGWVVHRIETTGAEHPRRTFAPATDLALSDKSCFVISKEGYAVSESVSPDPTDPTDPANPTKPPQEAVSMSSHHSGPSNDSNPIPKKASHLGSASHSHPQLKPIWDRERRELRVGDIVVKRFKWPAENQELVLDAFQELGWPKRIDNPLVAHPTICPKRRLHDTLKCLNRKQVNELIKFRGDGTGLGVLLELRLV